MALVIKSSGTEEGRRGALVWTIMLVPKGPLLLAGVSSATTGVPNVALLHHGSSLSLAELQQHSLSLAELQQQPGDALLNVVGALGMAAVTVLLLAVLPLIGWLINEQYVLSLRAQRVKSAAHKSRSVEAGSAAYVAPREVWTAQALGAYDGTGSDSGAILLAADGFVFNVAKARNFYGPGGEYAVMGGADATRLLARNSVQPETAEQASRPLTLAEKAALAAWLFSFKQKYDIVGRLATPEEEASLAQATERREAYLEKMDEMSERMETDAAARERLESIWDRSGRG